MASIADEIRASAARWPEDWPPQEHLCWEIPKAFLGIDEYMGELQDGTAPLFLLLVACALDGGSGEAKS